MSIIDPRIANSDLSLTIDVLSYPSFISDTYSMENTFKNTNEIDIIYPGVGENYDFITDFKNLHHKKI